MYKYYGENKDFILDFCTNLTKLINDAFKRSEEGLWKDVDTTRTSYSVVKGLLCDDKLILAYKSEFIKETTNYNDIDQISAVLVNPIGCVFLNNNFEKTMFMSECGLLCTKEDCLK